MKYLLTLALFFITVFAPFVNLAYAKNPWALSIGTYSLEGEYGKGTDTAIHMIPVSLAYKYNQWQYQLSTGYLWLDGDQGVITEGSQENRASVKEAGLADSTLSVKYRFKKLPSYPLYLNLSARIKFPTADHKKKLGTGKRDLEFRLGAYWGFDGWWGVTELGYKSRKEPRNTELNSTSQLVVGGLGAIDNLNTIGVSAKFREPSQPKKDRVREVTSFLSHKINSQNNITFLATKGFSDASPDWGLGAQWRYSF